MAEIIKMPKMSDTMEKGVISTWFKNIGDTVKCGELLAEIETDKATMDFESPEDGVLLYIGVMQKQEAYINDIIAIIGTKDEDVTEILKAAKSQSNGASQSRIQVSGTEEPSVCNPESLIDAKKENSSPRLFVSPVARSMAKTMNLDLATVIGTGISGRVIKRDLDSASHNRKSQELFIDSSYSNVTNKESYEDVAVSNIRATIAKRLTESKNTIPHFYLTTSVDMDNIVILRSSINDISSVKISVNDILIKFVAAAIKMHPEVNAACLGDKIRYNKHIHIGIAIAVKEGLYVPVVRFADNKSFSTIATEVLLLRKKTEGKLLKNEDIRGSTFTISNLGMFGIEAFAAIINPPESCILSIGAISQIPVIKNGNIIPGNVMKLTLSCDHRTVDGAIGASFLRTLKSLLENPMQLLL